MMSKDKTKETLLKELKDLQHDFVLMKVLYEKEIREILRAEQKFRKVFMTSPDSININRLSDGMYVSINEIYASIMGSMEQDVIGKISVELTKWFNSEDSKLLVKDLETKGSTFSFTI
jgi:two-component system, cell cycle sensor histidine kinase and response regulator CckA